MSYLKPTDRYTEESTVQVVSERRGQPIDWPEDLPEVSGEGYARAGEDIEWSSPASEGRSTLESLDVEEVRGDTRVVEIPEQELHPSSFLPPRRPSNPEIERRQAIIDEGTGYAYEAIEKMRKAVNTIGIVDVQAIEKYAGLLKAMTSAAEDFERKL